MGVNGARLRLVWERGIETVMNLGCAWIHVREWEHLMAYLMRASANPGRRKPFKGRILRCCLIVLFYVTSLILLICMGRDMAAHYIPITEETISMGR